MDWEAARIWIHQYGYLAVGVGTLLDQSGLQAFVIAGGVVASADKSFSLLGVMMAGALGSFASDVAMYGIGRWRATWLERIVRSNKGRMRLKVLEDGMKKYAFPLIVFGRLMPWIGRFVPAAAGLRHVSARRALWFSLLGAMVTGAGYGALGYYAAETVTWLEAFGAYIWVGALLVSLPVAAWLLKRFDRKVMERLSRTEGQPRSFKD